MAGYCQNPRSAAFFGPKRPAYLLVGRLARMSTSINSLKRAKDERVNWAHSIPFFLVHVLCFAFIFTGITATALWLFVAMFFGRAFFVTAGYHRYFSHKSYKLNR